MKNLSMPRLICSTVAMLVPAIAFAQSPTGKADKEEKEDKTKKVDVCHITGNGSYLLINISNSAVQAHLAHGDALPGSLVGNKFVGEDCSLKDTTRAESPELKFGPLGWGGWSCPADTTVVGGGYEPADATVLISEAAKPGSASGLYPVYPHYTFPEGETGWVVQNNNTGKTLKVYAICIAR